MDYEPCENCAKSFEQGILLIEVSKTPLSENQLRISETLYLYPTGNHWVITPEGAKRVFDEKAAEQAISRGKALIDHETAEILGLFERHTKDD